MTSGIPFLAPTAQWSSWTWFSYFMIAAAPALGSVTTGAGVVASMIAAWSVFRNRELYPISPAIKYLVLVLSLYSCALLLAGVWAGADLSFLKSVFAFSQFIYFIPLVVILPYKARDMTPLGVSRAAMAGVAIATVGAAFENMYTGTPRVELLSGNPLPFAALLAVLSFLSLAQLKHKSVQERWLSIGVFLAGMFTIAFLVEARGVVFASVVFSLIALCVIGLSFGWRMSRLIGLLVGIAIVLVMGLSISVMQLGQRSDAENFASDGRYVQLLQDIFVLDDGSRISESTSNRLIMYKAGVAAFAEQPILGYGPQNRHSAAVPHMFREPKGDQRQHDKHERQQLSRLLSHTHLHNFIVTHAVAAGMVGMIAVILVLTSPLVLLTWMKDRKRRLEYMYFALIFSVFVMLLGTTNLIFFHDLSNSFHLFNTIVFSVLIHQHNPDAAGHAAS